MSTSIEFHNDCHVHRQNGKTFIHRNECLASIKAKRVLDDAFSYDNFGSVFDESFGTQQKKRHFNSIFPSQKYIEQTGLAGRVVVYEHNTNRLSTIALGLFTGLAASILGNWAYNNTETLTKAFDKVYTSSLRDLWDSVPCKWKFSC